MALPPPLPIFIYSCISCDGADHYDQLSIQIRTLQQLQASEAARRKDMTMFRPQTFLPPPPYSSPTPTILHLTSELSTTNPRARSLSTTSIKTVKDIIQAIQKLQDKHASIDEQLDTEDLLTILRTALHEPEDVSLIRLLEIEKPEWPEAIKSLQRRLEEIRSDRKDDDTHVIHREFVESGIDCLRRMSGEDTSVPSWTITKYEVNLSISPSFLHDTSVLGRYRPPNRDGFILLCLPRHLEKPHSSYKTSLAHHTARTLLTRDRNLVTSLPSQRSQDLRSKQRYERTTLVLRFALYEEWLSKFIY